jgi:hypothetical protein
MSSYAARGIGGACGAILSRCCEGNGQRQDGECEDSLIHIAVVLKKGLTFVCESKDSVFETTGNEVISYFGMGISLNMVSEGKRKAMFLFVKKSHSFHLKHWLCCFFIFEKMRQIFVDFIVQSRKEICKESLLSCFSALTFSRLFCHLWLLRVSFVVFDLVICGI